MGLSVLTAKKLAMGFDGVEESPHFEKTSFRVNKKIFLTIEEKNCRGCLKLSEIDQDIFAKMDSKSFYAVPNKWGQQGWTFVELKKVKKEIFSDALMAAYCEVAPSKLSSKYKQGD